MMIRDVVSVRTASGDPTGQTFESAVTSLRVAHLKIISIVFINVYNIYTCFLVSWQVSFVSDSGIEFSILKLVNPYVKKQMRLFLLILIVPYLF